MKTAESISSTVPKNIPNVLTNCHNSLCAVGGTINEDDHMFGLTCAQKYGGIYVPPHQAVIHQFAREMLAKCGDMILGSDSHTRYGTLGTMAIGEGVGELAKQLLGKTYDVNMPGVIAVHLTGSPVPGAKKMIAEKLPSVKAYAVRADGTTAEFDLATGDMTDDERKIIQAGCLINFYRG